MTAAHTEAWLRSRRTFLVRALSLGWLAGGAGWNTAALANLFGKVPGKLPEGRSVFDVRGEVTIDGRPVTGSTVLKPTDTITTGSGSYLVAAVGSSAFIIRERSALHLGGANPLKRALRLVTGKMLGVFGALSGRESLSLQTPAATIGIRGTGIYAEAEPHRTYLCTCYGTTELASTQDPSATERVTARHHDAPRYILTTPEQGRRIVAAPFINHTDLELVTLEALVGRTVPFGLPDSRYDAPRRDY